MELTRFDPRRLAAIYAGGVIGALTRVGLAQAIPHGDGAWPWATFAVNMAGALLLGYLVAALRGHRAESPAFALLTTGICGTLTTFATLQLELFELLEVGQAALAAAYVAATLAGGYACIRVGLTLGRGALDTGAVHKAPRGRGEE